MAKRLYMSSADYLAIAISPALIMALVGSLVFFLIEVLYVGDYEARLMYVFALFVFAAVLIGRISIEMGTEYASLFALPLGLATFLVLVKFVEHPSPLSHLINLALMLVVWWCAHKLTWDCTLIDDDDASGEGLIQRIGVDEAETGQAQLQGSAANELFDRPSDTASFAPWWQRWFRSKKRTHAPGLWVLYFSLAALPLFGIGQHWIPAADVGRRRYVFVLLLLYVASALFLLVTTSFLGLRRYLRQRRIEMPNPMAVTWVVIGGVLIAIVMLTAALIPRPNAEYEISQVPWQAHSPAGLSSSRAALGRDAPDEQSSPGQVIDKNGPQGDTQQPDSQGDQMPSEDGPSSKNAKGESEGKSSQQQNGNDTDKSADNAESNSKQGPDVDSQESSSKTADQKTDSRDGESARGTTPDESKNSDQQDVSESIDDGAQKDEQGNQSSRVPRPQHVPTPERLLQPPDLTSALGGLAGIFKLLFYILAATVIAVLVWRHRRELAAAIADILRQLRNFFVSLFGGRPKIAAGAAEQSAPANRRERTFAEFGNPFATGEYRRLPPEELVRYTFDAFEAWARDGGYPRSTDQTPAELVRAATAPGTALHDEARRMLRLYSEVAYASAVISPSTAHTLRELWSLLGTTVPATPETAVANLSD